MLNSEPIMETIKLQKRTATGKQCKKLLRDGFVPCVVYNIKGDSKMCQIDAGNAEKSLRGVTSATMLNVELDETPFKALVKEVDTNPRKGNIRHISFFELDESAKLVFEIPFEFVGISPAVKNNLGVLVQPTKYITVRCKASELVPHIEIDISRLINPGQSILVKDITLPSGMELLNKEATHYAIVTISDLQKEIVQEVAATETPVEGEATEAAATEEAK